jgi:hypothetical protein
VVSGVGVDVALGLGGTLGDAEPPTEGSAGLGSPVHDVAKSARTIDARAARTGG